MATTTEQNKKVFEAMLAGKKKRVSKKKTTRKRRTSKKRVTAKKGTNKKVIIHAKVKAISPKIAMEDRPKHSSDTMKQYGISIFRLLLAKGCRRCKSVGFVGADEHFCDCQNVVCESDFINYYEQFTYWYHSKVNFNYRHMNAKDEKGSLKKD